MHQCNFYCTGEIHTCNVISEIDIMRCTPEEVEAFKASILDLMNSRSRYKATSIEEVRIVTEVESPSAWYEQHTNWTGPLGLNQRNCYLFFMRFPDAPPANGPIALKDTRGNYGASV